jgi:predicted permease
VLVVAQVAMALLLLVSSGLMMRTLQALRRVDPGFKDPRHVQTFRLAIPDGAVKDADRVVQMHRDILDKIAAIPGVIQVSATSSVTMDGWNSNDPIIAEDQPPAEGQLPKLRRYKLIAPGYFQTMGNRIVAGRDYTWIDLQQRRPYIMLSEKTARDLWHDPQKAIGKRVRENLTGVWREVIGVVADDYDDGVERGPVATAYWPLIVNKMWDMDVRVERGPAYVIRSDRAGTPAFMKEVEKAVWSVNPDLPLARVRTLGEIYDRSMARTSFTMVLLAVASGMALLLGVVGIYGVISYAVTQRTREIGIRIALGAPGRTVQAMFVRHGLVLAGIGVAIGIAASAAATRLLSTVLFGVSPLDPITYIGVAAVLTLAALLASYIPARRATEIAPLEALRAE